MRRVLSNCPTRHLRFCFPKAFHRLQFTSPPKGASPPTLTYSFPPRQPKQSTIHHPHPPPTTTIPTHVPPSTSPRKNIPLHRRPRQLRRRLLHPHLGILCHGLLPAYGNFSLDRLSCPFLVVVQETCPWFRDCPECWEGVRLMLRGRGWEGWRGGIEGGLVVAGRRRR